MSYLNGIHLANGAQDVDTLLNMAADSPGRGLHCFTYLDGQAPEAAHIKAVRPDALLVMRLWSRNFLTSAPPELAYRLWRTGADQVIPWNEANLPSETGGDPVELARLHDYWDELVIYLRALVPPSQLLHFPAWSPADGAVGPFWPGADVYDLHLYGTAAEMLTYLDRCLPLIPDGKPVFISEWNMGRPWAEVSDSEVTAFLDGLALRGEQIIGATAFIWRWENPDPALPNLDLEGAQAAQTIASWSKTRLGERPQMPRSGAIQSIIDFQNSLAAIFASCRPIKRKEKLAWAEQAAFSRNYLEAAYPLLEPSPVPPVDLWRWPVVGGAQRISVVNGETQDSEAHARRGVGPSVDLPGANGTPLRTFVCEDSGWDIPILETGYDGANGYWATWEWVGGRGHWRTRYSHLPANGVLEIGATGDTTGGNVHIILWLDGERVRPEDQPEFMALLVG